MMTVTQCFDDQRNTSWREPIMSKPYFTENEASMIISEMSDAMMTAAQNSDNQRNMSWRELMISNTYGITRADERTDMQHNSGQN
jgi:hypothetical protein